MVYLKNEADTQDIFQTVFLKYVLSSVEFNDEEHEKAWFIRVTVNACKDLLRRLFHRKHISLEEAVNFCRFEDDDGKYVIEALYKLPQKYRDVLYLHYFEGYTAPQISNILNKKVNTVYTLLNRSKQKLKKILVDEYAFKE